MHDGALSIAPYASLTVAAAMTAVLFVLAVVLGVRRRHMLVGAAAMGLLSLWFGVLAVTAGPAPAVRRGIVADPVRWLAVVIAALWFAWLVSYALSLIKIERRHD